jgi:hypothetical protein
MVLVLSAWSCAAACFFCETAHASSWQQHAPGACSVTMTEENPYVLLS